MITALTSANLPAAPKFGATYVVNLPKDPDPQMPMGAQQLNYLKTVVKPKLDQLHPGDETNLDDLMDSFARAKGQTPQYNEQINPDPAQPRCLVVTDLDRQYDHRLAQGYQFIFEEIPPYDWKNPLMPITTAITQLRNHLWNGAHDLDTTTQPQPNHIVDTVVQVPYMAELENIGTTLQTLYTQKLGPASTAGSPASTTAGTTSPGPSQGTTTAPPALPIFQQPLHPQAPHLVQRGWDYLTRAWNILEDAPNYTGPLVLHPTP